MVSNTSTTKPGHPRPSTTHDSDNRIESLRVGAVNIPLSPISVFLLMGKTGAGKSSFIELLGGKDLRGQAPEVSDGLESCIRTLTTYTTTVENNSILLLDTPGFDDSVRGNIDVLRDIVSNLYLFTLRKEEIKVRGIIFLYDISDNRFAGSQAKTLEILKALCGGDCMGNVIVGTTMWDQNSKNFPHQVRREESFCKKYWQGIHSTTRLFEDDEAAAGRIILDLLALPPVLLLVQKEIMKPPHTIENTTVWKSAMPDGYREIEELKHQKNAQAGVFEAELNQHKADFEKREQEMRRIAEDHLRKAEEEIRRSEEVRLKHEAEMMKQYEETKLEFTKQMKKRAEEEEKRDLLKQTEEVNQRLQEAKNTGIEKEKQDQINEADRITFTCTAEGCHKAFQAATNQLVRKALMRHLFRYQKDGVEIPKDAQDSDLTAKQIFNRAHYLAYQIEVVAYSTSEEKQAASRAKYKEANKEKVARASRIAHYRAQAKKIPEIMGQGIEAAHKWAEEKEENRKQKGV